jgi:hypothetical protein
MGKALLPVYLFKLYESALAIRLGFNPWLLTVVKEVIAKIKTH